MTFTTILQEGTLKRARDGTILDAHSSVILIQSQDKNIIVDTGFPGDEQNILDGLAKLSLVPEDIDIVINTHLHIDHLGGNHLFESACFYVHDKEQSTNLPTGCVIRVVNGSQQIDENISIIHTPGHTPGCISVVIKNLPSEFSSKEDTIVCAGDALPLRANYLGWLPPGINFNREIALESLKKITGQAQWVIPGHDRPFKVD